jgi:hypothetical protein
LKIEAKKARILKKLYTIVKISSGIHSGLNPYAGNINSVQKKATGASHTKPSTGANVFIYGLISGANKKKAISISTIPKSGIKLNSYHTSKMVIDRLLIVKTAHCVVINQTQEWLVRHNKNLTQKITLVS